MVQQLPAELARDHRHHELGMVTDAEPDFGSQAVADLAPRQQLSQTIEQLLQSVLELGICQSRRARAEISVGLNADRLSVHRRKRCARERGRGRDRPGE